MRKLRNFILFLLVLVVAYGVWWFVDDQYRSNLAKERYDTYGLEQAQPLEKERVSPGKIEPGNEGSRPVKSELLFLIAGVDAGTSEVGTRTDTLILCKVNWMDATVSMLSIPRDSYVYIKGDPDKVNHAHSYGGMQLTMKTIRDAFGIDLDYYYTLDLNAIREVVDLIGGIEMEVREPMASDLYLEEGLVRLNGFQALEYLRYRKGFESGDLGRVSSQAEFLRAALPQIFSPKHLVHFPSITTALSRHTDTNIGPLTMASMVPALFRMGSMDLESAILPGEPGTLNDISYYFLYPTEVQWLMDTYLESYQKDTVYLPE